MTPANLSDAADLMAREYLDRCLRGCPETVDDALMWDEDRTRRMLKRLIALRPTTNGVDFADAFDLLIADLYRDSAYGHARVCEDNDTFRRAA